jgi:uncharacterized coiled-coil protein SlyX
MSEQADLDLHHPRARRYAEAIATAAAAEEKINALTEQLTEHEWHRSQAESQVEYLRERLDLGGQQVIASTDDPPGPEVRGLICLATGRAWVRPLRGNGSDDPNYWVKAAASTRGQTRYEWPIQDAGPFIALPDNWDLAHMNRQANARDEQDGAIRNALRHEPGYPQGSAWTPPALADAVVAVLAESRRRRSEVYAELSEKRNELDSARRELDALKAQMDEVTA